MTKSNSSSTFSCAFAVERSTAVGTFHQLLGAELWRVFSIASRLDARITGFFALARSDGALTSLRSGEKREKKNATRKACLINITSFHKILT